MSKDENQINSKDFLIGSLIGGIIGASAAFLLTPKSGKELRTNINEQATNLKQKTVDISRTAKERGTEIAETARNKTENLSKSLSEQVNKVKEFRRIPAEELIEEETEIAAEEVAACVESEQDITVASDNNENIEEPKGEK